MELVSVLLLAFYFSLPLFVLSSNSKIVSSLPSTVSLVLFKNDGTEKDPFAVVGG